MWAFQLGLLNRISSQNAACVVASFSFVTHWPREWGSCGWGQGRELPPSRSTLLEPWAKAGRWRGLCSCLECVLTHAHLSVAWRAGGTLQSVPPLYLLVECASALCQLACVRQDVAWGSGSSAAQVSKYPVAVRVVHSETSQSALWIVSGLQVN